MKLLPYNGFYPVLRTVQLGQMLSQSFGPYIGPDDILSYGDVGLAENEENGKEVDRMRLQALLQPFFAPGIMFNTIKSGIAIDWPTYKSQPPLNVSRNSFYTNIGGMVGFITGGVEAEGPNYRLPFEALIEPNRY